MAAVLYYLIRGRHKPASPSAKMSSKKLTRREQAIFDRLEERGFDLEEIHPVVTYTIYGGDKEKSSSWQGNFTVRRSGKIYLVKVINEGSPFSSAALRRELMADQLIFQPEGIFIFNAENDKLQELGFTFGRTSGSSIREKKYLPLALIVLIMAGLALLYRLSF